jgi:predicted CXXCH cytochrome family protein
MSLRHLGLGIAAFAVLFLVQSMIDPGFAGEPAGQDWPKIDQAQYVGSAKCAECHQQHFAGWKDTAHNKMIQPPVADGPNRTVLADFSKPDPNRPFELKDVKWVIGHRWKQRFIGEVDGKEVVFPAQWSVAEKKWMPYEGKSDWWYPTHKDWKTRSNFKLCAGCHSTGSDHTAQTWVEQNISCESCHGPGKEHAGKPLAANIVNPARLSVERSRDVCMSCHLAGKPPGDEYAWAVGYQPGMDLSKFWTGFAHEAGKQTPEYWHNGTAHKNRVQGNTFLQSVMAHSGLQCTTCHASHGSLHTSMTVKAAETNGLCLTCHGPGKTVGPDYKTLDEHTHHAPLSTGSRCIECHMSKTGENSVKAESRDHTFNFRSPAETIKSGDPNACNTCHKDKTPEWALAEVKKWYPKLK